MEPRSTYTITEDEIPGLIHNARVLLSILPVLLAFGGIEPSKHELSKVLLTLAALSDVFNSDTTKSGFGSEGIGREASRVRRVAGKLADEAKRLKKEQADAVGENVNELMASILDAQFNLSKDAPKS